MEKNVVLPNHVIEEILLRLPVKDLLPWKCVSKCWYALIWDDEFVKKHYRFQYTMHLAAQGDVPLLLKYTDFRNPAQFRLLTKQGACDVVVNIAPDFERDVVPSTFSRDFQKHEGRLECIGVVNGIVGLQWGEDRLALWNPASREFKHVPRTPIMLNGEITSLGFDLHSNDFKILRLIHNYWSFTETDYIYEFHLYSLKADSWKIIKDTPGTNLLTPDTDAYFSNGVHYWISHDWYYCGRVGIVAFNFSSDIFKEFEPPRVKESWYRCGLQISKYKERLALLVESNFDSKEHCIEIWAAIRFRDDDYEVPSSWELVVKTSPIIELEAGIYWTGTVLDCEDIILSIGCINCDDIEDGYLACVYHPSMCTVNYLSIKFSSSHRYVESLFPLSRKINYISPS